MSIKDSIVKNIFSYFSTKKIFLREDWIKSLIESNNLENAQQNQILYDTILNLIKSTDISEYANLTYNIPPPESMNTDLTKYVISNKYFLFQIQKSFDTSVKPIKEDKKVVIIDDDIIYNPEDKEDLFYSAEVEIKEKITKRVTKLFLSYGLNNTSDQVVAIETERISIFDKILADDNNNLDSLKVIVGPDVIIRKGIWCLNNSNIQLI